MNTQLLEVLLVEDTAPQKAVGTVEVPEQTETSFIIHLLQQGVTKRPSGNIKVDDFVVLQIPGELLTLTNRFVTDNNLADLINVPNLAYDAGNGEILLPDFIDLSNVSGGEKFIDSLFRVFNIVSADNTPGAKKIVLADSLVPAPSFITVVSFPTLNLKGLVIVPDNPLSLTLDEKLAKIDVTITGTLSQLMSSGDLKLFIFDDGKQFSKIKKIISGAVTKGRV